MHLNRSDLELEVLMRRIEEGEIDLQPEFQRGEIWNNERKKRLIDSILRNWYIPPVHIVRDADTSSDSVLDGQQRLSSIRDFFAGELKIDGTLPPRSPEIMALHGRKYADLPDEWRRRIRRFPLTVVTLTDYAPEEPYELFFRLNQSYALTPSEKRNALYGPARDQVKRIVEDLTDVGLLSIDTLGFDNQRLAYDDVIARTCLTVYRETLRAPVSSNAIEDFYRSSGLPTWALEAVSTAGRLLWRQLEDERGSGIRLNKATLYSWLIFFHRAGGGFIHPRLISKFEVDRRTMKSQEKAEGWFACYLAVYNDRASYRVADTFSVLARDLILHLANDYYSHGQSVSPKFQIFENARNMQGAEVILKEFFTVSDWGDLGGRTP